MDPAVLVLDEPTTGQDREGIERVGAIVRAMRTAGRTVIAITHDLSFASEWFDRIVVMRAGRVVDHPPPAA
jgi:energy-coupling factor transporter ATP-binding protein EcfA2